MAEPHHKPEIATSTTRYYTVGYVSDAKYEPLPSIHLKGRWLEEAGFETGTPVDVQVMPGHLLLSVRDPTPEPSAEPEVVTTLKRACKKLSARKQQQIADFIEMVATPQKRLRKNPDSVVEWRTLLDS